MYPTNFKYIFSFLRARTPTNAKQFNNKPNVFCRGISFEAARDVSRNVEPLPACQPIIRFFENRPPLPACSKFTQKQIGSYAIRPTKVAGFYLRELPENLVDFGSTLGKQYFAEALQVGTMESYFKLAGQYHAQSEPAFCGLTVLCMVLNSLSIDPARVWKSPWRWYSEEMMGCCTPLETVRKKGISFDKFRCLATCKGANVKAIRYNEGTLEQFRKDIIRVTTTSDEILIVSYNRKHVGQTGSGHFAPVGGYHEASDRVLLLDVARFKYPPHWVNVERLFEAMKDIDPETGKSRGYFLISGLTQQTPNSTLNKKANDLG